MSGDALEVKARAYGAVIVIRAFNKNRDLNTTSIIGIIAGIFTSASLLPQLIKILKEKKVEDLSMIMFLSLLLGIILWVVYGVLRADLPIIVTNSFSVLLNCFILILKFKYQKNK